MRLGRLGERTMLSIHQMSVLGIDSCHQRKEQRLSRIQARDLGRIGVAGKQAREGRACIEHVGDWPEG